jgi:antitoxin HicB
LGKQEEALTPNVTPCIIKLERFLKVRSPMKTLNEYLALPYRMEIVEDCNEGGCVVSFPELPGCITCGETVESAVANAEDAKREWITAALQDGITIHEPDDLENYSGQFKLRLLKLALLQTSKAFEDCFSANVQVPLFMLTIERIIFNRVGETTIPLSRISVTGKSPLFRLNNGIK